MADRDYIWSYLHKNLGLNDMQSSVAMGFFQSESGNNAKRLEGDYALKPDFALVGNQAALDAYSTRLFNMYKNSGVSINQSGYTLNSHYYPGLGMCQWTGSRSKALMDYAAQRGQSWTNLSVQLDYLGYEMSSSYAGVLSNLKNATTFEQAMAAFAPFEHSGIKPGTKMYEERYNNALTLFSELTGTSLADLEQLGLLDDPLLAELFGDYLGAGDIGMMIDPMSIDCFIAYVPPGVFDIDYDSLRENRFMGVAFYGGDITSGKYNYRSPSIEQQVLSALEHDKFPFAMIVGVYAHDEASAKEECDQLYYTISRYPPGLGLWLELHTTSSEVLDYYYKRCQYWGLGNACGLYCDKDMLDQIGWDNYKDKYLLWLVKHFETEMEFELLDTLLMPEFFDPDGESMLISGVGGLLGGSLGSHAALTHSLTTGGGLSNV